MKDILGILIMPIGLLFVVAGLILLQVKAVIYAR